MQDAEWEVLERAARTYAAEDPDVRTQRALLAAVDAGDRALVAAAFEPRLEFGTAGLRGPVGPGPARMNVVVCARFAWALGTFLCRRPELAERGVVIGFDARHDSELFARVIEDVLRELGLCCFAADAPVPTPVVAFGVRFLRAGAGVVVTASHNPAGDNGIKLYDDEGMQIVGPWDEEIEALMQAAPRYANGPPAVSVLGSAADRLEAGVIPAYLAELRGRALRFPRGGRLRVAYTPLHGVGLASLRAVLSGPEVELAVVAEQAEPDPDFPTAPFPNPEEAGALDRLLALARSQGADIALANDPDADRLAVALPDGAGDYVQLSGDEVGLLLAAGIHARTGTPPVCVSSIVSSPGLDAWAEGHGGRVVRTLTGFKWLARAACAQPSFTLAYEEALGYCVPPSAHELGVLDKDGLSAAVELCDAVLRAGSGSNLLGRLAELTTEAGVWVCHAASIRLAPEAGPTAAAEVMTRLRQNPPSTLGGELVDAVTDFLQGAATRSPWLGRQDLLRFTAGARIHVLVRPSGTEPKVKIYTHLGGAARGPSIAEFLDRRRELLDGARGITEELRALAALPHQHGAPQTS